MSGRSLTALAAAFRDAAEWYYDGPAPLYATLGRHLADRPEVLARFSEALPRQHPYHVLFAAAHHLLLRDPSWRLARFYPSLGGTGAPERACEDFVAFLEERAESLVELIDGAHVQTNHPRRAAIVRYALGLLAARERGPFELLELGASAGLNLLAGSLAVELRSPGEVIRLPALDGRRIARDACAVTPSPPWRPGECQVSAANGIDLRPRSLVDEGDRTWLKAQIWADEQLAHQLFDELAHAVAAGLVEPPSVLRGDERLLAEWEHREDPLVFLHTCAMSQMDEDARGRVIDWLEASASLRPVYWVALEGDGVVPGLEGDAEPPPGFFRLGIGRVRPGGGVRWLHVATAGMNGGAVRHDAAGGSA